MVRRTCQFIQFRKQIHRRWRLQRKAYLLGFKAGLSLRWKSVWGRLRQQTWPHVYWSIDINKTPDVMAFAVLKGIPRQSKMAQTIHELSSAYSIVIIEVPDKLKYDNSHPGLRNKSTSWRTFEKEINNTVPLDVRLSSKSEIDEVLSASTRFDVSTKF